MTQPSEPTGELFVELDLKLIKMPAGNVRLVVHDGIEVIDIMETNDADPRSIRRVLNEILRLAHVKGIATEELAVRLKS